MKKETVAVIPSRPPHYTPTTHNPETPWAVWNCPADGSVGVITYFATEKEAREMLYEKGQLGRDLWKMDTTTLEWTYQKLGMHS